MNNSGFLINIAHIEYNCKVLGPGNRSVIWVQGCNLNCKNCINKNLQSFEKRNLFKPLELFNEIMLKKENIEGITITGGEPFLQAKALSEFAVMVKKENLSIQVYTGFYLEELISSKDKFVYKFLDNIDVLIDGRYKESDKELKNYRGSSNQRVLLFTERYNESDFYVKNSYEVKIDNDKVKVIGFYNEK